MGILTGGESDRNHGVESAPVHAHGQGAYKGPYFLLDTDEAGGVDVAARGGKIVSQNHWPQNKSLEKLISPEPPRMGQAMPGPQNAFTIRHTTVFINPGGSRVDE